MLRCRYPAVPYTLHMTSTLKRVYGNQALYLASQAYARLHVYATYAQMTSDLSTAPGRMAYCVATDTIYAGEGGAWVAMPAGVGNGLNFLGAWNASTNSPTVTSGSGTAGQFYKVSVAGSTTVDGNSSWNVGDILLFDGVTWDQLLGPSGGGGGGGTVLFSSCNLDSPQNPSNASGTHTTGRTFYPAQLLTASGVRFFWNGPAGTILCSLWNAAGTKMASCSVSVTSTPGIFSGTFGSPYTFLAADLGTIFTISMSESTGTYFQNQATGSLVPSGSFSPPGVLFNQSVYGGSIDAWPTTTGVSGQYIIEPVFS
jgi:hypothetical protein